MHALKILPNSCVAASVANPEYIGSHIRQYNKYKSTCYIVSIKTCIIYRMIPMTIIYIIQIFKIWACGL